MTRMDGGYWVETDDTDVWTSDRFLDGSLPESDVPPGYEAVASLIGAIRAGVAPAPSGWGSQTVPAMAEIISRPPLPQRRSARGRASPLSHVAAAVGVFAALGSGSAAAATGSLPSPVQSVVHSAASALGVPVPGGSHPSARGPDSPASPRPDSRLPGQTTSAAQGGAAHAPPVHGLTSTTPAPAAPKPTSRPGSEVSQPLTSPSTAAGSTAPPASSAQLPGSPPEVATTVTSPSTTVTPADHGNGNQPGASGPRPSNARPAQNSQSSATSQVQSG